MASNREELKEAAVRIGIGKLVAPGTRVEKWVPGPTQETPCNASDHHSQVGMPSLDTAMALFTKNPIFSCNVSLFTRSDALSEKLNELLQNPKPAKLGVDLVSQAKVGFWAVTEVATRTRKQRKQSNVKWHFDAIFWIFGAGVRERIGGACL